MAESNNVAGDTPDPGTGGPVEGMPVLPEILAEAQRKLEALFSMTASAPLPAGLDLPEGMSKGSGVGSGPRSPLPAGEGSGVGSALQFKTLDDSLEVTLPAERLLEICSAIRNDLGYRMLMSITAVDWKTRFELVYHLYRLDSAFPLVLRCNLPHEDNPEAPSLMPIWPGADFQEREIYDLMGIVFTGHPDLRRILLADDFQGHPLRKDFEQDPDYVLVPHLRIPGYSGAQRGETSTGRFLNE